MNNFMFFFLKMCFIDSINILTFGLSKPVTYWLQVYYCTWKFKRKQKTSYVRNKIFEETSVRTISAQHFNYPPHNGLRQREPSRRPLRPPRPMRPLHRPPSLPPPTPLSTAAPLLFTHRNCARLRPGYWLGLVSVCPDGEGVAVQASLKTARRWHGDSLPPRSDPTNHPFLSSLPSYPSSAPRTPHPAASSRASPRSDPSLPCGQRTKIIFYLCRVKTSHHEPNFILWLNPLTYFKVMLI